WQKVPGLPAAPTEAYPQSAVTWSPDSSRLAFLGGPGFVARVWQVGTNRPPRAVTDHLSNMAGPVLLLWSPDGKWLATTNYNGIAPQVQIWDAARGRIVQVLEVRTARVSGLVWSLDSRRLVSAGGDGTIKLW